MKKIRTIYFGIFATLQNCANMKVLHCSFSRLYSESFSSCNDCAHYCACSVHNRQVLGCIFCYNRAMIEQIHVGNAAICTKSVDFRLILRFHKSAKTDMLTPKDLQIFLHQWSNKYSFWYLQSSQSMIVGGQVFQSRLTGIHYIRTCRAASSQMKND